MNFCKMTQQEAEYIAAWEYEGMYSFYNMENDKDDLEEFMSEERRGDCYFSVYDGTELIGFFAYYPMETRMCIGLGMKPSRTGNGQGLVFVDAGLQFGYEQFGTTAYALAVATFNKRAIHLYEKVGFVPVRTYTQETNGGEYEFLYMIR
ncbi:GNAT family N-acetyltransferase [Priestia taiwanensis]|uniref:N-acetyltransferase n=1 Tax=Priestia taiwanensis TaxID=1347902 RepID=A0A917ARQ4_9BACI|nr:GNAT family N-acetyltransferase [Priestia taiwanensis]MBM7363843.1 ribosomal-protein-alanine N-acetyltransferase [Priestia taiwanensis]GGE69441.1 N-acetyltransferase [Priestia taiwanensis]